jgi:hypothetical protein
LTLQVQPENGVYASCFWGCARDEEQKLALGGLGRKERVGGGRIGSKDRKVTRDPAIPSGVRRAPQRCCSVSLKHATLQGRSWRLFQERTGCGRRTPNFSERAMMSISPPLAINRSISSMPPGEAITTIRADSSSSQGSGQTLLTAGAIWVHGE